MPTLPSFGKCVKILILRKLSSFFKLQNCYVCLMNLPAHELDDHLLSHVLVDNPMSGQFVSDTLLLSKLPFHYDARLLQIREKAGLLEAPWLVQRPRVSRYGLKTFLCSFWNSSGVLHDRLLETSQIVTLDISNQASTQVANKYCSHYDKTSTNSGRQRSQDNARKHTTNQRKPVFFTLNWYNMATKDVHSFRSLQNFLAEKLFNDVEEVKTRLNHCLV